MVEAYPLHYPNNKSRTPNSKRIRSRFKSGLTTEKAQRALHLQLERLKASNIVVSTNMPLRKDGGFYSSAREPDDPGVAVYFIYKEKQKCFACDKYDYLRDNIWAIAKTIEAIRGIERWGTGEMVDQAFAGFDALPDPSQVGKKYWWEILNVSKSASKDEIRKAYITLAQEKHPDKGGDADNFSELSEAYSRGMQGEGN